MSQNLRLEALAIGSLPHSNLEDAISVVKKDFSNIPFFPQLANYNKNEDMITQLLEGLPSFSVSNLEDFVLDSESEEFLESLEEFFADYEEIIEDINSPKLEKYAISKNFSSTFPILENIVRENKPQYAKGQITGPFTMATSLVDKSGKCIIYDETLTDIIVKLLSLKVLWIIKHIKKANPNTIPIIFMDEPSISQIGTSAYITISEIIVVNMIREISDLIKQHGAISAIHCCGKCDWRIPLKSDINIINFDAYTYSQNFSIYTSEINNFLQNGGKIAWGLVPTLDKKTIDSLNIELLIKKFENSVKYLTKKGIDEKLIIDNSLITSSCGAGSLPVEAAEKAMDLVYNLSKELKERFKI